jgi:hypothetical protein
MSDELRQKSYTVTCNMNIHIHTHTHTHTHTHHYSKIVGNLQNYRQIELVRWTQFLLISTQEGRSPLGNNDIFRKARERECFTQSLLSHICSNLPDFCKWTLKAKWLPKPLTLRLCILSKQCIYTLLANLMTKCNYEHNDLSVTRRRIRLFSGLALWNNISI